METLTISALGSDVSTAMVKFHVCGSGQSNSTMPTVGSLRETNAINRGVIFHSSFHVQRLTLFLSQANVRLPVPEENSNDRMFGVTSLPHLSSGG